MRTEERLAIAVKALRRYADTESWGCSACVMSPGHTGGHCLDVLMVSKYGPDLARETLDKILVDLGQNLGQNPPGGHK